MSQGFKLRYDQLRENDPTKADSAKSSDRNDFYDAPSNARNLCFIWPDGKRIFIGYSYLVSGEFKSNEEKNVIILNFSSYTVTLKGFGLEPLFMAVLDHLPRQIVAIDSRYVLTGNMRDVVVTEIKVIEKENS